MTKNKNKTIKLVQEIQFREFMGGSNLAQVGLLQLSTIPGM